MVLFWILTNFATKKPAICGFLNDNRAQLGFNQAQLDKQKVVGKSENSFSSLSRYNL